VNAAIHFCCQPRPLGDGSPSVMRARTVRYGKAPGDVTQLIDQLSMRVGDVEGLHELQAWSPRRRLIHPVCF